MCTQKKKKKLRPPCNEQKNKQSLFFYGRLSYTSNIIYPLLLPYEEELLGLPQIPSSQVCLHLPAPSCTLSIPTPHPCLQVLSTVLTPTSKVACACFGAVCVCYACWLWSLECQWDPVVAGLTRQPVLQLGTMFWISHIDPGMNLLSTCRIWVFEISFLFLFFPFIFLFLIRSPKKLQWD